MMNDRWADRLSEYIDDELTSAERAELVAHLATCDACTAALGELRRVAVRARSLGDRPPAADLWPAIAAKVSGVHAMPLAERAASHRGWRRRVSITLPQLIAA